MSFIGIFVQPGPPGMPGLPGIPVSVWYCVYMTVDLNCMVVGRVVMVFQGEMVCLDQRDQV